MADRRYPQLKDEAHFLFHTGFFALRVQAAKIRQALFVVRVGRAGDNHLWAEAPVF